MSVQSIAYPYRGGANTCGYCSPPGQRSEEETSYQMASLHAIRLSSGVYQRMIDRGWRRSGTYCYKPDLRRSCCPQYTIKLDALQFKPGRSQRKLLHRWNRYILHGQGEADAMDVEVKRAKGKDNAAFDMLKVIHAAEHDFLDSASQSPKHKFEVVLEPSSYTEEKFDLYCKYQRDIHNDKDNTIRGFKRFLVETPLQEEPIPYPADPPSHLPRTYGSYHQLYRVDGRLVALAILDILPNCVSSVYFMYDNLWEHFSMGKLSALREASLAYEIHKAGVPEMQYVYMGFYIHSCQKMRYKGDYSPSFLADPETYQWYPIEHCKSLLEKNRYACFSNPSHCIQREWNGEDLPEDDNPEDSQMAEIYIVQRGSRGRLVAVPLITSSVWTISEVRTDFYACIRGLGLDLAGDIFWAS
ncbi:arginine-tRNA-protein transferase 1 [Coprinopsis cinerea AmutBmut pab1-1]|nr:arginine-tRNA-protein transferase 1 [Coprinopsis cinerea AmutBmut pab1-1]